jgi:hypothetical protein
MMSAKIDVLYCVQLLNLARDILMTKYQSKADFNYNNTTGSEKEDISDQTPTTEDVIAEYKKLHDAIV